MFDVRCLIPAPTDVIAITSGKCPNNQRKYTPILPFSFIARIGAPSTVSKYSHHRPKVILRPKASIDIEYISNLVPETPATTPVTDSPRTIIVKRPIRSGRCVICGANCGCNLPTVIGVAKSITRAIPHNTNRNGGGINAEIIHIPAAHRKPLVYLRTRGVAEEKSLLLP